MSVNKFKSFTNWAFLATLATNIFSPNLALAQSSTSKKSLEQSVSIKSPIRDRVLKEKRSQMSVKMDYDKENKELFLGFYPDGWNKETDNWYNSDKNYLNIRDDSKLYIICPKDNLEFDRVCEYGYVITYEEKDGKERVFGDWDALIGSKKNPDAGLKLALRKKTISEAMQNIKIPYFSQALSELLDYKDKKKELNLDKIANKLGKEYEVREIEVQIPEGLVARINSAIEIKIDLEYNPDESKKILVLYNLSFGRIGAPIGALFSEGSVNFTVPGVLERKLTEEEIDNGILETVEKEADKDKYAEYLKRMDIKFKKYFPQKKELPSGYFLKNVVYTLKTGEDEKDNFFENEDGEKTSFKEITGDVVETVILKYSDIKKNKYDFDFKIMKCKKDAFGKFGDGLEFLYGFCYFDKANGFIIECEGISKFDFEQDLIEKQMKRLGIE
jgi:hypothetical protein